MLMIDLIKLMNHANFVNQTADGSDNFLLNTHVKIADCELSI